MVPCQGARDPGKGHAKIRKKLKMLGRTLRWTDDGLKHEAGKTHKQALLLGIGMSAESKTPSSVTVRTEDVDLQEDEESMETESATKFRCLTAKEH